MRNIRRLGWALACAGALMMPPVLAQSDANGEAMRKTATSAKSDLEQSKAELNALREQIALEKLPLTRRLNELEAQMIAKRSDFRNQGRELDTKNLEVTNLEAELKARQDEKTYLAGLLDEYVRNFETQVHITELQRYRKITETARLAADDSDLKPADVFAAQASVLEASLDRLLDLVGGARFPGQAVDEDGRMQDVDFALVGPVAFFSASDGRTGLAELRMGSLEPRMLPLDHPEWDEDVRQVVASGAGLMPLDPTQGNARKMEATKDSLIQHMSKGGPVMIPIVGLAFAALLVALLKWFQIVRVPNPSKKKIKPLLDSVHRRDYETAGKLSKNIPGPVGEMLRSGVEHLHEPKELVEEVMYEKTLETRLRLQSLLPFIAVSAAAAPLLGLLGTVTGIINTFKMITVFGTGDAQTLSGGISEALITTKFGLIVAIPSLLLHAYLSRSSRRLTDGMEKTAVSFLNRVIPGTPYVDGNLDVRGVPLTAHGMGGAEPALVGFSAPQQRAKASPE